MAQALGMRMLALYLIPFNRITITINFYHISSFAKLDENIFAARNKIQVSCYILRDAFFAVEIDQEVLSGRPVHAVYGLLCTSKLHRSSRIP